MLALLLSCAAGSTALGQRLNDGPSPPPPTDHPSAINPSWTLTESISADEAFDKAVKSRRLLVLFFTGDSPDNPNWTFRRAARSMSLRAYIKWHCVAVHTPVFPRQMKGRGLGPCGCVYLVRDGEVEEIIKPSGFGPPGPLEVLFQADFAMDRIKARDPMWAMRHDEKNPAPKPPPEPEPLSNTQDEIAPIVRDPRPEENIGPLDRLAQARALVKTGEFYQATGLYTWLWERGSAVDPSFRPAKLSALAQDIKALIELRPGARERFEKIRDIRTERTPWADHTQMHDWFVLNGATGNAVDTIEYLDYFLNDLDESSMIPPGDVAAFRLFMRRSDFAAAWEQPPASTSAVARVAGLVRRLNPKFPASILPAARAEYQAFAQQFIIDEGSRLYVACLVKGDEAAAQEIARTILNTRNDAGARLALITTALAADPPQPRAVHLTWLDEAEGAGTPGAAKRPDLRTKIGLGINPVAKP